MKINRRQIGPGHPTYIIAEMSANHNQNYDEAVRIIHAAKESGADAIKLQTYTADTLTLKSDKEYFKVAKGTIWEGKTLHDLYQEAYMPWDWQPKLQKVAQDLGLDFFSAAYDPTSLEFLEKLNVPVHKITSFEIVDIPLIALMAKTGKPMIISTGMATKEEITLAVETARNNGAKEIALLKCTSGYPAEPDEMHLKTIPDLIQSFKLPVGLSDHTLGITVPVVSVAFGASIIEKHFTMSRSVKGPDSSFSLEPAEFKAMVEAVRIAEKALGEVHYGASKRESHSREFRRSIFAVKDIPAGAPITDSNVRSIRPAHGLPPKELPKILGKKAKSAITAGTPISMQLIE